MFSNDLDGISAVFRREQQKKTPQLEPSTMELDGMEVVPNQNTFPGAYYNIKEAPIARGTALFKGRGEERVANSEVLQLILEAVVLASMAPRVLRRLNRLVV